MDLLDDKKRKLVQRAYVAAQNRISAQTGLIHLWEVDPRCAEQSTIPYVENFFYVLTLMQLKGVDQIKQARVLLDKLLYFTVDGMVPHYLHEFPVCREKELATQLLVPIFYLLKEFRVALGEDLTCRLELFADKICILPVVSIFAKARIDAYRGILDLETLCPKSASQWAEFCCFAQMMEKPLDRVFSVWNSQLDLFIGHCLERYQEKQEPVVSLLDLFMSESGRSQDPLIPALLRLSVVYPITQSVPSKSSMVLVKDEGSRHPFTLYFGSSSKVYSFVCQSLGNCLVQYFEDEIIVEHFIETVEEEISVSFYLTRFDLFKVNGRQATLFYKGDVIESGGICLEVTQAPKGVGILSFGDRLYQKGNGDDIKISWRALETGSIIFKISIQ